MLKAAYLLVALVLLAEVVIECSGGVFPVNEVSDCMKRGLARAQKKKCGFLDEACEDGRYRDAVLPCVLLGYDLIYQDSTYHLNSDFSVYGAAHCAIEKCSDVWSTPKGTLEAGNQFQILKSFAESWYSCLQAMQDCVTSGTEKDEL